MLAGKHKCPPVFYMAVIVLVVTLVCVGVWSKYRTHEPPVRTPLHDPK